MRVSLDAWAETTCPRCHSCNSTPTQHHIKLVANEKGLRLECSVCGNEWAAPTKENR